MIEPEGRKTSTDAGVFPCTRERERKRHFESSYVKRL